MSSYLDVEENQNENFSDADFDAFVEQNQQDVDSRQATNKFNFTDILYTSIPKRTKSDPNAMSIVRFRGGPPNSDRTPYTARSIISSLVRDDKNRLFKLKLPVDDKNHLYWRIINTVLETEGRGKTAIPKWDKKFPDIYNRVRYGELRPSVNQFKYGKGWKGREWLISNVIDRTMMDVHRQEKHCMLLCKDATVSKKDPNMVFYDDGVPAYGFISALTISLFQPYKNWENYDVGIIRIGQKEMPYRLINASRYLPEIPEALKKYVVPEGPLTEEEKSWGMYDLEKLAKVTTYNSFLTRVGGLVMEIDTAIGTTFFDELTELAAKEAAEAKERGEEEEVEEVDNEEAAPVVETPKPRSRAAAPVVAETSDEVTKFKEVLTSKGFNKEELDSIKGYHPEKSVLEKIEYTIPMDMLVVCNHPGCGGPSPEFFHACPHCLKSFT